MKTFLRLLVVVAFAASALLVAAPTDAIVRPSFQPSRAGQYIDTYLRRFPDVGHECFISAPDLPDGDALGIFVWVKVPCRYGMVRVVRDWRDWNEWRAVTASELEQDENGRLVTGAWVAARRFQWWGVEKPWMPPGTLSASTMLFVWNDWNSRWDVCRDSGWVDMPFWANDWGPAFDWGPAPCGPGRWYNAWNTSHLWNGYFWQGTARWSGAIWSSGGFSPFAAVASEANPEPPSDEPPSKLPKEEKPPKVKP